MGPLGWKRRKARRDAMETNDPRAPVDGACVRPEEWAVGQTVPGTKWEVLGRLGQGGMGLVLAVRKQPAGIDGAMKILLAELITKHDFRELFLEEAKLLANLRHPHIVEVIDYDVLEGGLPFMVMKRMQGQTLRGCLRGLRRGGHWLTARNAWSMTIDLCDGLQHLHSLQPHAVVHRDVKPENIFIDSEEGVPGSLGALKLLDFGLAGAPGQSCKEIIVGTPRYMAPELLRGQAASPQADQYSAALVLYEMLTGRLPWDVDVRDAIAVAKAHVTIEPTAASRYCRWLPPSVDEAIARALKKQPSERWPSVSAFAGALGELRDVDDGSADACPDANTTAPTLATLANALWHGGAEVHDTAPQSPEHPIEGPQLEVCSFPSPGNGVPAGEVDALLNGLRSQQATLEAITRPYGDWDPAPQRSHTDASERSGAQLEQPFAAPMEAVAAASDSDSSSMIVGARRARRHFASAYRSRIALAVAVLATVTALATARLVRKPTSLSDASVSQTLPSWLEKAGPLVSEPPAVASERAAVGSATGGPEESGALSKPAPAFRIETAAATSSGPSKAKARRGSGSPPRPVSPAAPDDGRDLF
jgi:serine/threonine protein kinase